MDIQYVILGLLSWQPFSGYDLKKMISRSDLFYWSGNNNQIYNNLVELHQRGLVEQEIQPQESLPARKIYSITAQGRAQLREWALAAPEAAETRHHFLIQLAWAGSLSDEELEGLLAAYEAEAALQLQMRQARATRPEYTPERTAREKYIWRKIEQNLLAAAERELEWAREVRSGIRERRFELERG